MKFIADLHIHSHYSRATSKALTPEQLEFRGRLKGITIIGTGDFTHPGWLSELHEKTEPDGYGLLKLKKEYIINSPFPGNETRFLLTAEISNIYKRGGKVRKVHNVILVPDFNEAKKINRRLINLGGNLTSDGRPILGLDSRDLLEIVMECSEKNYFIPAHIWTPWFSMLGSKSGFDSLKECFDDLSPYIHTIETGLSTDPPMNWLCSFLDKVTMVSNSDAHSPERLGRNANIFNTSLDYYSITDALRTGNPEHFLGTIDMFPQEGKYHYDGHRKCNICWDPYETLKNNFICPVCKKPVTIGVMNRIINLSDREDISERPNRLPFHSIIPLKEILSEIAGLGVNSKRIEKEYMSTLEKLGTELDILMEIPPEKIESQTSPALAEAIKRMRNREVIIKEGYDGEYGEIKVFNPGELSLFEATPSLFIVEKPSPPVKRDFINFDLKGIQKLLHENKYQENLAAEESDIYHTMSTKKETLYNLNPEQLKAVMDANGPTLVIAGPGTGKTKTLTSRIAWLQENLNINPSEILAITFTNKAAGELRKRLKVILNKKINSEDITVATFHAFGLTILKEFHKEFRRSKNFTLADENLKTDIIKSISQVSASETKNLISQISEKKRSIWIAETHKNNDNKNISGTCIFNQYENKLQKLNAFDLDDLIIKPLILFSENKNILNRFQQRFRYIFVDEYQDINDTQYRLLRLLAPDTHSNIYVVGDANQSIYGFRGANSNYIKQFTNDYPEAKIFQLDQSYRCSRTILNASSDILELKSDMLKGIDQGVNISISEQPTDAAEAEFIARQIVDLIGGVSFFSIDSSVTTGNTNNTINTLSDLAILCRTRSQFNIIGQALQNHNLPYQEVGTTPFFRQEPFQTLISLLNIFSNENSESANKILKLKNKQISEQNLKYFQQQIKKKKLSDSLENLKTKFFKPEEFDEHKWIRFTEIADEMNNTRDFLEFLILGTGTDTHNHSLEAISLMTLHASKGLEFECVFIAGCENGLLPYNLYKKEVDREEERRLLYVGMTRAKKMLFLTHARNRTLRGRKFKLPVSPFLHLIKLELLNKIENTSNKKPLKKDSQLSLFNFNS
jgi:DNA helicase II / ATP-dependent DNA helicase PcrA